MRSFNAIDARMPLSMASISDFVVEALGPLAFASRYALTSRVQKVFFCLIGTTSLSQNMKQPPKKMHTMLIMVNTKDVVPTKA
mmetsp:Transcript_13621/g.29589  ORF Transcript_13621/g.29589 Transcript_13621/m.29589 type:complete len:83 (+) Transcript_13621:559-807(+)